MELARVYLDVGWFIVAKVLSLSTFHAGLIIKGSLTAMNAPARGQRARNE